MNPPAATSAGGNAAPERRRPRQAPRQAPRPAPRPESPRRVSGPLRGRAATGPSQPLTRPAPLQGAGRPIWARGAAFARSLPDHRLLDRLIRGRVWIPLLGVMLAGIVAMQVEVLKLGASMGRSLELNSALSVRNASLRESVASLGDDQRIEQLAAGMGMVMPPPQAIGFLPLRPGADAARAAANIHQPDPGGFLSLASSNGAVVTATNLAAWNQSGTTSTSAAPSSTSSSAVTTSSSALSTASPPAAAATPAATAPAATALAAGPTSTSGASAPTGAAPTSTATPSAPAAPANGTASPQGAPQAPAPVPAPGPPTGAAAVAPATTGQTGG
jgi:hypothetical protein